MLYLVRLFVDLMFKNITAADVKPELPHDLLLGDFPDWFGEFMIRRFLDTNLPGLSESEVTEAKRLITERVHHPPVHVCPA